MEKITFNKECNNLKFNIYKIEVGVLWTKDEEHEDYDCYNNVYDKQYGYYDENVVFELDYNKALDYAKYYVENGVNGTYAINKTGNNIIEHKYSILNELIKKLKKELQNYYDKYISNKLFEYELLK